MVPRALRSLVLRPSSCGALLTLPAFLPTTPCHPTPLHPLFPSRTRHLLTLSPQFRIPFSVYKNPAPSRLSSSALLLSSLPPLPRLLHQAMSPRRAGRSLPVLIDPGAQGNQGLMAFASALPPEAMSLCLVTLTGTRESPAPSPGASMLALGAGGFAAPPLAA